MSPPATPCGVERMRDRVKKRAASKWAFVTAINGGRLRSASPGAGPRFPFQCRKATATAANNFFPSQSDSHIFENITLARKLDRDGGFGRRRRSLLVDVVACEKEEAMHLIRSTQSRACVPPSWPSAECTIIRGTSEIWERLRESRGGGIKASYNLPK